jgi:hypothetical protein
MEHSMAERLCAAFGIVVDADKPNHHTGRLASGLSRRPLPVAERAFHVRPIRLDERAEIDLAGSYRCVNISRV